MQSWGKKAILDTRYFLGLIAEPPLSEEHMRDSLVWLVSRDRSNSQ
jgi:hypothetical protein